MHVPQVIIDHDSSQSVRIAVIAHPWSLLGSPGDKDSNLEVEICTITLFRRHLVFASYNMVDKEIYSPNMGFS